MHRSRWPTCLWPGLPQLWWRGSWAALAQGVGFAWLAALVMATTLVWTEWIGPTPRAAAWFVLIVLWIGAVTANLRWLRVQMALEPATDGTSAPGDLFPSALNEYLQGNWFAAERLCLEILHRHDRDADALLLLSTLYRHTGKDGLARQRLDELSRLDGAAKWRDEIAYERSRLAAAGPPDEDGPPAEVSQDEDSANTPWLPATAMPVEGPGQTNSPQIEDAQQAA